MSRSCAFCGGRPLSKEHVLGQWMRVAFAPEDLVNGLHYRANTATTHQHAQGLLNGTVKAVCKPCNNGWMSGLESGVKPFLPAMINGRQVFLNREQQQVLAAWSLKTMLMMAKAHNPPEPIIPAGDYTDFYRERRPSAAMVARTGFALMPENAQVALASDFSCHALVVPDGHGYLATLRLGMFVVQILRAGPFPGRAIRPFAPTLQLAPLWPVGEPRSWPPVLPILHQHWASLAAPDPVPLELVSLDA
ncbi:hypothetical protein AB0K51_28350 [Kitasatospora sp. NPDC049285]|uniref:hypothetical protein n=1 Tax=Kitasatospora sp. NPDC049285 TaxID=3157096 RepID=UPI0034388BAC